MAKEFNVSDLMDRGYIDLKKFIDYSSPTKFLSRWMQEQLKWIMALGIFEIEGTFIKKKGVDIPTNCPTKELEVEQEQSFQNLDDESKDFKSKLLEIQNDFKIKEMEYLWNKNELINEKKELEKKVKNLEKEITIVQKRADDLLLNKENSGEIEMTESEFTKEMKKQQKKYDDAIEELNKYYLKVAEHEKTIHNLKQKLEEAQKEIEKLDSDTRYEDLKNEIALRKSRYESSQESNAELKEDINRIKLAWEYFRPWEEPKISKK